MPIKEGMWVVTGKNRNVLPGRYLAASIHYRNFCGKRPSVFMEPSGYFGCVFLIGTWIFFDMLSQMHIPNKPHSNKAGAA
ncbi:MAG: hypothetical protein HFI95_15385 [Lachnospiraceae bacterium]|nr:hypothetical protein [Lachnospiraceae bacterium]